MDLLEELEDEAIERRVFETTFSGLGKWCPDRECDDHIFWFFREAIHDPYISIILIKIPDDGGGANGEVRMPTSCRLASGQV